MKILTDSEIFEIKRKIANVLADRLKLAKIQIILKKKPQHRSESEIDQLTEKLQTMSFFQNKKLAYCDFRDLTQTM